MRKEMRSSEHIIVWTSWAIWCVSMEWLNYRAKRKGRSLKRWLFFEAVGLIVALGAAVILSCFF